MIWQPWGVGLAIEISDDQRSWLRYHHTELPFTQQAREIGVCVDTLKRILVREGLREFEGAKYVMAPKADIATWTRPCITCGSTAERPRNHYMCPTCRTKAGYRDT